MNKDLLQRAEQFNTKYRRRRTWKKLVSILGCLVVFCTTYALILPAITQERESFCGIEAHTHEEACYVPTGKREEISFLCSYESLEVHSHTPECYDPEGHVLCGQADYVVHLHNDDCYDGDGLLVCPLPEMEQHIHEERCYVWDGRHVHEDDCYTVQPGELICSIPEEEAHFHQDDCYAPGELLCQTEEGHLHGEGCFDGDLLLCDIPEGHLHDAACYDQVLMCQLPETEGHVHTEFCYEQEYVLTCNLEESEGVPLLVCTEPEAQIHEHDDFCRQAEPIELPLTCLLEESEAHLHSELCYGQWELICEIEEHVHGLPCYADVTADLETEENWKNTFSHLTLTGIWADDVLAIGETQLGYAESVRNYIVLEDGETTRGYTRYGEWYGDHYGDWCAMFVSFCLHYADVQDFPLEASCEKWIELLSDPELDRYRKARPENETEEFEPYEAVPGDLIFFDRDEDGIADHIGLVVEQIAATEETTAQIRTLEGNSSNRVQYVTYDADDPGILGYGILPENPQMHRHSERCYDENNELICGLTEVLPEGSSDTVPEDSFVPRCGLEEHTHEESCFDAEGALICALPEHCHEDICIAEPVYFCGMDAHSHEERCYDAEGSLICTTVEHLHNGRCIDVTEYFCGQEEHTHAEACHSETTDLICGLTAHTHGSLCLVDLSALTEDERDRVEAVILQIDTLPSAEAVEAKQQTFRESEDQQAQWDWEDALYQQVLPVYEAYSALPAELQALVVNREKLLSLSNLWSMALMVETVVAKTVTYNSNMFTEGTQFVLYTQYNGRYYAIDGNARAVEIQIDDNGTIIANVSDPSTLYWTFTHCGTYDSRTTYYIQNVSTRQYLHPYHDNNSSHGAVLSGRWESALYTSGSGVKFRGARQNAYALRSGSIFTDTSTLSNGSVFYFGTAASSGSCTIWLDGTNGGLMSLLGSPNTSHQAEEGSTFTLPQTWDSPTKYNYTLRGWYDVVNNQYYAPGAEMTVTGNTVLYADWIASNYDIGQFNSYTTDTVSTNQFITTRVFDYSSIFNMYSAEANVTVNASSHSESWSMRTDADSLGYIFRDWDNPGQVSYPSGVGKDNTYDSANARWPNLYSPELREILFGTANSFDPATGSGILGKQYLGTADHLFQYGDDPADAEHYGYYYYDSELNAAAYNQSDGRFYVYDYLERATDSASANDTKSDFLPLNSPYVNTNGKTVPQDTTSDGTVRYTYDAKGTGSPNSADHVHSNYWFGMSTDINFYLPSTPGTYDSEGNLANQSIQGEDMVFEFSGDDDVWVLVDGELVLDIGGIHGATSGTIDFSTGVVSVDGSTGSVRHLTPGNHTLTILYLERGSSQSNCKIRFNLSTRYHFTIQKEDFLTRYLLNGAVFSVFTDEACTKPAVLWNSEMAYQSGEASTHQFTVTDGKAEMWGFAAGNTYYIQETTVPTGYGSANGIIKLTLNNRGTSAFEIIQKDADTPISAGFTVHGFKINQQTQMAELVATNHDYASETTSVAVRKVWDDSEDHTGTPVTVYLMADGNRIQSVVLDSNNNWSYVWENLPKYHRNGTTPVQYTVDESTIPGYIGKVERVSASNSNPSPGGWATVTGFQESGVYLMKTNDGYLAASGNVFSWVTDEAAAKTSAAARWKATVSNGTIHLVSEAGTAIRFRDWHFYPDASGNSTAMVFQDSRLGSVQNGTTLYAGNMAWDKDCIYNTGDYNSAMLFTLYQETTADPSPPIADDAFSYVITNTPVADHETVSVTIEKSWDSGNLGDASLFEKETIPFRLLANGVDAGMTVKISLRTGWKGTFYSLPKKDADGKEIVYSVVEDWSAPGWRADYGELTPIEGEKNAYSIAVTNVNTLTYMLPETGGSGTDLYTAGGLLLMAAGLLLLYSHISNRRREERKTP